MSVCLSVFISELLISVCTARDITNCHVLEKCAEDAEIPVQFGGKQTEV